MSARNLIVSRNPARKRRSAAQKAASRRNIKKAQAARRSPRRRRRTTTKRRRRRNPSHVAAYRRPRRRSNPRMPTLRGIINNQVIPAAVGGGGAVLNDMLVNLLPLPLNFKVGWLRHVSKAVGAIAIGYLGSMFLRQRTADQLGAGAMTVVGYNVVRDLAAQFVPQLPLGEYLDPGLSEYLDPAALGYYGAGLNPGIPGAGLETAAQFTRGSPYMGAESPWPTDEEMPGGDF